MRDDLIDSLRKNRDAKRGPWKNVGPKVPPMRRTTKKNTVRTAKEDTEAAILREVILQARATGVKLWRQPAGKILTGLYAIQFAPRGAADLTGILPNGVRVEVECKRRFGGVQSDDQKEWQKYIEENNGVYILAHSGDEFKDQITPILKEIL